MKFLAAGFAGILLIVCANVVAAGEPDLLLGAEYKVPVPAELEPFATFPISSYRIVTSETGAKAMKFTLPEDLTGGDATELTFELKESQGDHKTLTGSYGIAECDGPWTAMTCSYRFENLSLDPDRISAFIDAKHGNTSRASGIKAVALEFSGDPIGTERTFPRLDY